MSGSHNETKIDINEEMLQQSVVHKNVGQEVILTTSDKIKLCLLEHQNIIKMKSDWKSPLELSIAILITLVTADFNKDFLGIKSAVWQALFVLVLAMSIFRFFRALCMLIKFRKKGNIDNVVAEIKQNSVK